MTDNPKRRWYQYSLRSMFILTTLFAIACSWYAYERRKTAKVRAAIAEIEKLGGKANYSYDAERDTFRLFLDTSDAGLVHLKGLANLNQLYLTSTQITDAGLVHLKGLTSLETLDLQGTQVTDAGMLHLKGLTKLERLGLTNTQITDAGLVHLKGLTNLKWLYLDLTQGTDAGLVHLKDLTNLEKLWLSTQITDEGVRKIQEALPNCKIIH